MFWDDEEAGALKKKSVLKVLPPVPDTGWKPPTYFPNLSSAIRISCDVETKELDFDNGPGWARNKGHIVGVSIGAQDIYGNVGKWYFPVRHEVEPQDNLDPAIVFPWLKSILETTVEKVFANGIYDIGWLTTENIYVNGQLHDVQFAEALLNEEGEVNLQHLGSKYLGEGKDSSLLYMWCAEAYGGSANSTQRANIYRAPPRLVGRYAESDADLPLRVLDRQFPLMINEGLVDVYRMECDSIYIIVQMRLAGVQVDLRAAEQLYAELAIDVTRLYTELHNLTGIHANVDSGDDLAKVFQAIGLKYNMTAAGNPSFTKPFLESIDHPVVSIILDIRQRQKIRGTFLKSYILESNVDGKVHCQFHPLRGDADGTRSGRYASSTPNLQNIPVRSKLGKRIRKMFIPDFGHFCWEKNDYSQIEYRMLAHFAVGPGSDDVRARYNQDPHTDYHVMTQQLVREIAYMEIERKPIKNVNFGLLYGMGQKKLARQIGVDKNHATELFAAYHKGNPYVKATMESEANFVQEFGYVETILGRRSRFDMFEPADINYEKRALPLPYEQAIKYYGYNIIRSSTHKAINRKLQGSAADVIKKAMHLAWQAGIFHVTGFPKLQVHDELDFSVRDNSPQQIEAYRELKRILEGAIKLRVPVIVDTGRGANWGEID